MSRYLAEESFPLAPCYDAPEKAFVDPSLLSTSTILSTILEYAETYIHKVSVESASTVFSHDEIETEDLLSKEPEVSPAAKKSMGEAMEVLVYIWAR
jgi:hypothetical protein